jgi:chorismate mutase
MALRGIRGATTVAANSKEEIIGATKELLLRLLAENQFPVGEVASILFTVTDGLDAEFPAVAAREIGWNDTPLLCLREIAVPGSLANCIRVLLHVNTEKRQTELKHVYLRAAVDLRR